MKKDYYIGLEFVFLGLRVAYMELQDRTVLRPARVTVTPSNAVLHTSTAQHESFKYVDVHDQNQQNSTAQPTHWLEYQGD